MSTRSQITVEGQECKLYKHGDGYPRGVLPVLVPFVADFMKRRGFDDSYMLARLTMAYGKAEEQHRQEILQEKSLIGFGIDTVWHGDLEYAYVVTPSGDVCIYYVPWKGADEYLDVNGKVSTVETEGSLPVKSLGVIPLGADPEAALKDLGE